MNGFVDVQVNGYAGVDFNQDHLTAEQLHGCCQRLEQDGVAAICATIITDHADAMLSRIGRVVELRAQDPLAARIIRGIHIEGPFLSAQTGFRGAHPLDAIRPADEELARKFFDASGGLLKIFTLAPEQDEQCRVIKWLTQQGVKVSGGHSDASLSQMKTATDAGMAMWTHLGNGCPMQMHRHDNIVQRVLSLSDRLVIGFIADGVHVPLFALKNYIRMAGVDHVVVVSDAMAAAGLGPGRHKLGRWEVDVGPDLAAWAPDRSHLVGSANTMKNSAANLERELGISARDIEKMCRDTPAAFIA